MELCKVCMQWAVSLLGSPFRKDLFLQHMQVIWKQCYCSPPQVVKIVHLWLLWYFGTCKTIECFVLLCSGWKLDSGNIVGNSVGLLAVSAVPSVVQEMLLTSKSSISIGCKFPMTVFLGMLTVSCSVLSRGIFNNFGYLGYIL